MSATKSGTDRATGTRFPGCAVYSTAHQGGLSHVTDLYFYYESFSADGNKVPCSNKISILCQISERWKH